MLKNVECARAEAPAIAAKIDALYEREAIPQQLKALAAQSAELTQQIKEFSPTHLIAQRAQLETRAKALAQRLEAPL